MFTFSIEFNLRAVASKPYALGLIVSTVAAYVSAKSLAIELEMPRHASKAGDVAKLIILSFIDIQFCYST